MWKFFLKSLKMFMFADNFSLVMKIITTVAELDSARNLLEDKTVGFVPTMGALHEGHASLVRRAVSECDAVIVSDFVNPTQFNNKTDFETYPRRLEDDAAFVAPLGVSVLFAPTVVEMYPEGTDYDRRVFDLGGLDQYGEGPRRPGHFNGMAQVVTRLFDIVRPSRAYFGEKDFQQLAIVEYFVRNLGYNIRIVRCPIARAEDGLALSSRNRLLTPQQRAAAPHVYRSILRAVDMVGRMPVAEAVGKVVELIDSEPLLRTEYVEIIDSRTMRPVADWNEAQSLRLTCAVYAGQVRLIDNIELR